jgi:hypothetical protein
MKGRSLSLIRGKNPDYSDARLFPVQFPGCRQPDCSTFTGGGARGKPKFVVTKATRPRMTRALAEARAVGDPKSAAVDGAAFLKSLKK